MLGRDHMLVAGAVGLAAAPVLLPHGLDQPIDVAIAGVVVAGFGLLPDIDEPGSTISRKLFGSLVPGSHAGNGVLSLPGRLLAKGVRTIARGHRAGTHSLLFVALIGLLIGGLATWSDRWTSGIVVLMTGSLSIRAVLPALVRPRQQTAYLVALLGAFWVYWHPLPALVLGVLAASGTFLHLVGDALTVEGVPFLFPLRKRFGVPLVGHTESTRERLLGAALSVVVLALTWLDVVHPLLVDTSYRQALSQLAAQHSSDRIGALLDYAVWHLVDVLRSVAALITHAGSATHSITTAVKNYVANTTKGSAS